MPRTEPMKNKPFTKTEMYARLAEKTGLSKRDVAAVFTAYAEATQEELRRSGEIRLPDLGKFVVQRTKKRMGRNPATGQEMMIPPRTRVKFRVAKLIRESVE